VTTISYDAAGRVDDLTSTVGGSPVTSFDYTVNRLGQREQVIEAVGGTTRTIGYAYDGTPDDPHDTPDLSPDDILERYHLDAINTQWDALATLAWHGYQRVLIASR
jgi:hypothetical protein